MTTPAPLQEPPDFSLVLGGPIFQLLRRSHPSGDGLELLHRRIMVIVLVAWAAFAAFVDAGRAFAGRYGEAAFFVRYRGARSIPGCAAAPVHSGVCSCGSS